MFYNLSGILDFRLRGNDSKNLVFRNSNYLTMQL
jgi:hypothetical protein